MVRIHPQKAMEGKVKKDVKKEVLERKQTEKEEESYLGQVGFFNKSDRVIVVAEIGEFKDSVRVDIREHLVGGENDPDGYTGPTKKGINIDVESFMEFYNLVVKIKEKLDEECLI